MIGNSRDSFAESKNIERYSGVSTISIIAVNPDNKTLAANGWTIKDDAEEPQYVYEKDGKKSARVRFLVRIEDLPSKPAIPLDFWVGPEYQLNKEGDKCKVIDKYCQTAWATKDEVKKHLIPKYSNGSEASICSDYRLCHRGEEDLTVFLMKFLNMPPYQIYNKSADTWEVFSLDGFISVDDWGKLCSGNVSEIQSMISHKPNNKMKVILGIRTTQDNKTVQTFATGGLKERAFMGENAAFDANLGEYYFANSFIDRRQKSYERMGRTDDTVFSAAPVHVWAKDEKPTEVKPADGPSASDLPDFDSPEFSKESVDDLPFD